MSTGNLKDYYELLGVSQNATASEMHKAYWQMASRCHPDRGGSHESMVQLVEAWKILSDPDRRSRYDQLLKYRHDGWQSKKFNDDVQDARKRAEGFAACTWEEFEEIYQKAFYTFNQDFYGEEIDKKAAGPYSPLMGAKNGVGRGKCAAENKPEGCATNGARVTMFTYIMKTVILFAAIVAALFFYRNYSGVGRYEPLGEQDAAHLLILDTTNGAVYSMEKRDGASPSSWKETVPPPFTSEKKRAVIK